MFREWKMKFRLLVLLFALAGAIQGARTMAPAAPSQTTPPQQESRQLKQPGSAAAPFIQDEVLVKFKDQVSPNAIAAAHARVRANVLKRFSIVKNLHWVRLPKGVSVKQAVELYLQNPNVAHAEPNYLVNATATVPNDPSFNSLWGLHNTGQTGGTPDADIDAPEAWDITKGSSNVVVAVIDTGVDYTHQDLAANIWSNPNDCNNNGIDDDGNGYVDDCHGIDVVNNDSDPMDDHNHGTHVSGTIGAVGNNSIGVVGVNWNVSIMACKFLSAAGSGTIAGAVQCLEYVKMMKDRGVNIVATNNSWSGGGFSQSLFDAIDAHRQSGILFVAAAGNDAANSDLIFSYPADYYLPNIIAVAATTKTDGLASFSNYGRRTVHVGAPGEEILSTTIGNTYSTFRGTSMATPHVTGVAALLKAQDPARDWRAIKNLILAGGDNVPSLANSITQKRLNAYGALTCSGSAVLSRLRPIENTISAAAGTAIDLSALSIVCASSTGNVNVTVQPGGQVVTLSDDGLGLDPVAGDGICSGRWVPSIEGSYTLTFPDGDVVSVQVLSSYGYSPTSFGWRTITGTSLNLTDDSSAQVTSPFPILFGGGSFNDLFVSSNGNVNFTGHFTNYFNNPIPTSQMATLVAPFWDDLYPQQGTAQNVFWDVIGAAPNRELVIEWRDLPHYGCSLQDTVKFQVVFFEGSSDVLFNYADAVFGPSCGADLGASATVGIQVSANIGSQFSYNARTLSDNSALLWKLASTTPDLVVSSLSVPASAGAGSTITISDTVKNQGGGSANASTIKFYLSADATLDSSDPLLGSRAVPMLAAGTTSSASTSVTIPTGTATGTYNIIAKADADGVVVEVNENNNTRSSLLQVGADLVISLLYAPSPGGAGLGVTINDTTKNQSGSAEASTTKFYLSADINLDAADTLLGSRAVPALASGASSAVSTTVTIPAGTAAGSYYIVAKADADGVVSETNENNNANYTFLQIGPDLVVSGLSVPSSAGSGAAITVTDTTKNQGGGSADASTVAFYLSTNTVLDAADILLGNRAVPILGPGATSSVPTSVTIPAGTATGTYYIIAKADADGVVTEISETNNTQYAVIQVGPDLIISLLYAPSPSGTGLNVTINDTTKNQSGSADTSTTKFYLSADTVLDASDVLLGSRAVPALGTGATSTASTTVTIPAGTATGSYFIVAKADADGLVAETNETNNTNYTFLQIGPDLVVQGLSVPSSAAAGAVSINDTVKNQGGGLADATTVKFYLSSNTTLDAGDILLGSRAVPGLGAGATNSASTAVTIPAGTATGNYYIIAKVDADGVVAELSETNNTQYTSIQVGADLVISLLYAPSPAGAGLNVTINDTTKNQSGSAEASTTKFYLSTNTILDASDILLASRAVPALGPGATSSASTTVTIPAGTATGSYYIVAKADADGVVTETNESNNTNYTFLQIGPDLVVSSVSVPYSTGPGASITVTDTTKNQGGGSADASTVAFYLSTNTVLDAADVFLGSRTVPVLGPGATNSVPTTVTIPAGTTTGVYYIIAKADAGGVVTEISETNNTQYGAIQVGPDLIISLLYAPSPSGAGLSLTINDTTKNQSGSADASVTKFYLSADTVLDATDVLLGSRAVPALGTGATSSASTTVTIPAGTATGSYFIVAKADADGVVAEISETNNTNYTFLQIGPDLVVQGLSVPSSAGMGSTITINETAKNQGGGLADAITVRFYLSSNNTLDASDILLGSRAVPALGAGATNSASTSVTIPAGTATGSYYIIAKVDADGVVAELSETNNVSSQPITISP